MNDSIQVPFKAPTLPPELVGKLRNIAPPRIVDDGFTRDAWLIERAYAHGFYDCGAVNEAELQKARDEELEACCADIHTVHGQHRADWLRSMRRPKPNGNADQGLEALNQIESEYPTGAFGATIRAALDRLKELEGQQ